MAKVCGLSKNYLSSMERGEHKCNVRTLLGYCERLDLTPNDILEIDSHGIRSELVSVLEKMDSEQQEKVYKMILAIL